MSVHQQIDNILDEARSEIRKLLADQADPVTSTDHPADPSVNPPADAATPQPSDQPVVSPDAPVAESAPVEPPAAPTA